MCMCMCVCVCVCVLCVCLGVCNPSLYICLKPPLLPTSSVLSHHYNMISKLYTIEFQTFICHEHHGTNSNLWSLLRMELWMSDAPGMVHDACVYTSPVEECYVAPLHECSICSASLNRLSTFGLCKPN